MQNIRQPKLMAALGSSAASGRMAGDLATKTSDNGWESYVLVDRAG